MTQEEVRQNIQLEMGAGNEAIDAAKSLVEKGLYRSAMSRTYYWPKSSALYRAYKII